MQNHNRTTGNPTLSLTITALQDATTVKVRITTMIASLFNPFTLNKLEETTIQLPSKIQMMDSETSSYVVYVTSNNPVSIVSLNYKEQTSDSASLYPVTELGTEYYVITPPEGSLKEFAIISKDPTTVTIFPTGTVTYSGKNYGKGKSFQLSLEGFQAIQFQSDDDLSGTRILSTKPVAVLSGHTCSLKFTKCNHVYEQLQPTFIWGTTFFIPTASFQTKYDLVYVTAATSNTIVNYQAGSLKNSKELDAGDVLELQLKADAPLFINSTDGIQVMYYCTGGYKGIIEYDTFLMTVPDVTSFCTSYQTVDMDDFSNEAILVAKTSDLKDITVNKNSLNNIKWNTIQETEYAWGEFPLNSNSAEYVFEGSKSPFSLSVFGISNLNAYGEVATCIAGSSRPSCSQVTCRKKEVCKISHGKATCQETGEATCWAWGDPHYHTYDGKNYDFQGTCSYTMSKTCDPDLPFFNIETVNENRGSSLVSYLKSVNIQVYNYNITGFRSEFGIVRVNNQQFLLPLKLNNDKVILSQSGTSLILQTDFKLKVIYDWNMLLKITVPSSYYNSVCGLCGNYNDNSRDDLSNNGTTLTPVEYGKFWKVKETSDEACHDDCNGNCVTCSNVNKTFYGKNQYCGILTQSNGPFKVCHAKIDPDIYKENCVFDMCLNDGYNLILCQTLKAYSDACAREGIKVGDWRNITKCPMNCPIGSTYNQCGSACPPTCLDPKAPSKCTEPCIEVCECNEGFVMIEGTCQPKANCGCSYQGRSINPGDSFWDDAVCQKKCFCNPVTRKVECTRTKCGNRERCLIKDGIQDCYPIYYSTCSASGDPHYVSFDEVRYDFQGACQYLMSGLCKNKSNLTDFQVIVRNDNLGSLLVSYSTAVTFRIFGREIEIRREFPAAVLVDGIKSNLPIPLKSKLGNIDISQSGRQCIVQTNLGIRVTFDWDARVGVTLPSTYSGSVCGLCGNFNGDSTDDLIDRDGKLQPDLPLFGHSWREGPNADLCTIPKEGNCTNLKKLEEEQKKNLQECGMVNNAKGPFRNCHSKIDPSSYFKDCVYDMCAYGKRPDLMCRLLTGYTASCQDSGVVIDNWRSEFVCPMPCPPNSRYNICASGCPSTCLSLSMSTKCDATCREGCECEKGYVLSGTECVPLSQCGCLYNSQYYKPGDIFYPENTCEKKCTCNNGGAVTCNSTSCGDYEICSIIKGVQSCNPVGYATCSAIGRTTFNTFDNFGYDFNGNCTYVMSQTRLTEGSKLTDYVIQIRNVDGPVTISKKVIFQVYNYNVTLIQGSENKILVNDILRNIPFELEAGRLRADYYGGGLVLKTDFGLVITLDNAVHVTVPATYHKQTIGLCGNYNDDATDELSPYDKESDASSYADSWKEPEDYCITEDVCTGDNQTCSTCPRETRKALSKENLCGILTSPNGPFSSCYQTIDPKAYFRSCINTLCTKTGEICTILQGYAKLCQDAGIAIKPWRTQIFCPYTCPQEHSHYELCADVCSTSCSSLYDITSCPTTCSEGCQCDTGYFFQNGLCVTPDLCNRCFLNSVFYTINETIISEDCSQTCTCTPRHVMVCDSYSCASDEICTVLEGKVQCINRDPCKSVTCRNKEHCVVTDANVPVCVPDFTTTCTGWGNSHFTTFDSYNFDFHGTCTYILAKYFGSDTTLEYFRIEEKNENRGLPTSSSARLINIFAYNFNISFLNDEPGQVRLNGEIKNLPLVNEKFTITQSGPYTVLNTAFGLKVEYGNSRVEITIPSSYFETVGGLCGNLNGNPRDDKVSPDNKPLTVITKWAQSWKVSDDDFCWDTCHGNCVECNETQTSLYEGEQYCGLLETDDGPFKDCYDKVSTSLYFNNCVKDVCRRDGLGLCQAFEAYVTACRKEGVLIPNWRNITGCDMNCPKNSHYEFCGTACQATCFDKNSPNRCTEPCVESCQANEGYVLSAGEFIDVTTCGCMYKDHYYKPNEEFWSNDKCSVHCRCDPLLGMVVCREDKCQDSERCMLRSGVRGCYPVSFSTCVSTGDPHYTTFDGRKFDFMGSCTYQLTGLCPSMDPNLTPFQVTIQNDRRGSKTVSYTKSVTLEVYNKTITLTRDHPNRVLVNGVAKFIPLSLESNKIKVFMKGEHAFVRTDFEVTINYNWDNYGRVMVPNTYANSLCGLCGNFNQDPSDDLTPDGTKDDQAKFEEMYRVGKTTDCEAGCIGECRGCSPEDTHKYSAENYCGIIKKTNGPFSQCYNVIDPSSYFNDCIYDSCLSGGQYSSVCGAIARYVSECQEKGVTIEAWRQYTICDPICPPNSHYELCGPGCHTTCSNLNSLSDCVKTCTEGCYCNSDFVLSGDTCVSISQCGCDYNNVYYQQGQTFYPNEQCNEQCQCTNGQVECQAAPCGHNEECKVVNGAIGCHSKTTGTCQMAGNRLFVTYDGLSYNLQGSCSYLLTEVCSENLELGNFSIVAESGSFGRGNIAGTNSLRVNVHEYEIIINREAQWLVTVNGESHILPLVLENGKVKINQEGFSIVLQTDFEVVVRYDTINSVYIEVPSVYQNSLCGLCGDFNGHFDDDLRLPSGQLSVTSEEFQAAWGEDKDGKDCSCKENCEGCDNLRSAIFARDEACGLLLIKDGPFADCYRLVNVTNYFNQCLMDMCASDGQAEILCQSLQAYATVCQASGAKIQSWRTSDFCNFKCPLNSHYELCADTCDGSCSAVSAPVSCTQQCSEGCVCNDGYLFDGGRCVSMENCGCVHDGRYYNLGDSILSSDCLQQCTCQNGGIVECSPFSCKENKVCKIDRGKATCQENEEATCWAWGDPHYHTFDGKNYDFQGTCSYTMSKTCNSDLPFFKIETVNENRGSSLVSYLKSVNIQVYNYNITGFRSEFGIVRVNNQQFLLPIKLNNNTVILSQSGTSLILQTDFKLKVIYDWDMLLKITIPSRYYNSVCGLCGNYNNNPNDDLSNNGTTLTPVEYGKLWKVKETSDGACHDDCNGDCVTCTAEKKVLYGKNQYCGILTQSNGPFKICHDKIDPKIYRDNCVFDMCLNDGYNQILCQTLKAYSDACAREGIQVDDWRTRTNCPVNCPSNSTYNQCGSACPPTCLDPKAPSKCSEPCIEVCECNEGFAMIEGTCQPKANCGCSYQGHSINPGDSFWEDTACQKKCFCNPVTRKVECTRTKCGDGERCLIKDGIQDCYPVYYSTCTASGDPHYVSFDDYHYDFQGACQYLLSGLCKNKSNLTDFQVIVRNQNQGSLLVSSSTAVTFRIFGREVQIRREYPATVLVDGIKSNLPIELKTKVGNIAISQSGRQCIVQTNLGIRVTFDWDARVGVTLPSTYSGSVCGLCGNFNGDSTDDLIDRDGKLQPDFPLFGHSWREGPNADQCKIVKGGNCTNLLKLEEEQMKNLKECGMVLSTKGPFRKCHSKLEPSTYFKDCVYDMCSYGKRPDLMCRLLTGYAASCQDSGVVIDNWRSEFVCPMSCPPNSRYNVCASGCPSTCLSLSMSTKCDATCREGCECEKGYVLSGTECVPLSQCGCLYNSQYYKPGDIFYPENTCENKCTCNNGGAVTCNSTSCGDYEICSIIKGVQSCNPVGYATCSAIGRTTFNTFDNFGYDFNGNCTYVMSQTRLTEGSKLTDYVIQIRNVDDSVTISKKVIFQVYNYTVTLIQGSENKILVNDILRNIPFELEAGKLRADYYGGGLVLKTDFGLVITLDNAVHVTVPATYHNQTSGLCGNYNDDTTDELSPYDKDASSYADSWKEPEDFCTTEDVCTGDNQTCSNCLRATRKALSEENLCGILTSPNGPFSPCYQTIDPKAYFRSCINTLCTKTGELCTILQGYAKLCQDAGIAIKPWRTQSFCPYTCSQEHSHYELCADVCSTSCSSLYDITSCPTTCSEGCQCDTGYFFQNGLCVTPDLCNRCFLNSVFYTINETIISEDCSQTCTCTPRHVMVCDSYSCASDEICTVLGGKVQCINKDPCKSVTCRNKEHCEVTNTNVPVCVPDFTTTCTGWGNSHFTTFDSYNFDFHGTCTYILAEYFGSDTTLEYFRIEEKNENRGLPTSSSARVINIFAYNFNISFLKDEPGQVRLNGEIINLPLINDKFTVTQTGLYAVLNTAFGLKVEYGNSRVEITIPSSYYASMGGLCGNLNGNPRDDKVSRDNKPLTVITQWARSWKVSDDDYCCDTCGIIECNETQTSLYEEEQYCGLLETDDGPFKDCYSKVSTSLYFNNCVKDVCIRNGLGLCQAFEAYVTACRKEGVLIPNWRNITGCDMNCPKNSHYEFCGTACQATCFDKNSPNRCTEPCVESCQANEGYVLSAGELIDVTSCGCMYKDLYYKPNQEFWSDDTCSVRCRCDPLLGMVVCRKDKCQDSERCMLRSGVRDCYPVSYSTCVSTGDPHYTTFDGRKFDFMGSCTYQLTGLCPSMDPNLTPFQVTIQNDRRGSKTVSYTKSVTLEVYNKTITLTRDHPNRVLVNGVAKFIPLSLESNKIKVFMKGEHAFVRTDFEVTINYNWDNYGRVMVPNTYANSLCGLCGNFNQDPSDDLTPDGTKEDQVVFEERYRVGERTECNPGCIDDCPHCSPEDTHKYSAGNYCGIIKKTAGPFSQCYNVIDPSLYFNECIYDSCLSGGQYSSVCGAIARYVSECQEKGVTIKAWRQYTICDPICPPNSHYELCGPGCHTTCSNLNSLSDCVKTCTEGCYCDSGFVLSGDTCVSMSQCGCDYNNVYYQQGQTFYPNEQCNEQCQCTNGQVECQAAPCSRNEECKVVNGVIGCHSKTTGTCQMAGNRLFVTYDGLSYTLQGSCSYPLTEVCSENLELGNFSITAESGSFGRGNIAGTSSLKVNVHGYEIIINREEQWLVTVDGETRILPLILDNGKVEINQEGFSIVLQTDFEVVVRYDTINSVYIEVPSVYQSSLCGLCGDFNGHFDDDLRLPSGQLSVTTEEFQAAWGVDKDGKDCSCKENCEGCDNLRSAIFSRDKACGLLLIEDGPFADCYGLVNVTNYFNQCLMDMCASDGQVEILCQSLQAYASVCQASGAKIQSWRTSNFCNLKCPLNSHYELCADTCGGSCSVASAPSSCTQQCSEGCVCNDGYLFDGGHCVSMENCGCVHDGRYYNLGDSIVSSDCLQQCTCQNGGIVQCSPFSCSDTEYCSLHEGKYGCLEKRGLCTLSNKGSLVSFDKLSGSIASDNTFDFASVCNSDDETWFRIVVITQNCKNDDDSDISAVHAYFPEFSVALSPSGSAWINGRTMNLPYSRGSVTVVSTKKGLVIRSGEDMEFTMSQNGDLNLSVHQKFSGSLCGACGNYNKKKSDDLQIHGKNYIYSFSEFIVSLRSQDFVRCVPCEADEGSYFFEGSSSGFPPFCKT
ncbi:IgGFc-binding protein-like [Leptodactylus fuscus]